MAEDKLVSKDVPLPDGGGMFSLNDIPESMLSDTDLLRRIVELSQQQGQESANVAQFMSNPTLAAAARSGLDMPGRPAGGGPPRKMTDEEQLEAARGSGATGSAPRRMTDEEQLEAARQNTPQESDQSQNPPLFSRERISGAGEAAVDTSIDVIGGVNRGLGPMAVGAVLGAPFGPVGAATGALAVPAADMLVQLSNAAFGTNWETPSGAIRGLIDRFGAGDVPETDVMRWWETAVQQVGQTAAFSGLMNILGAARGAAKSGQATRIDSGGQSTGFGPDPATTGPASVPVTAGRSTAQNMAVGLPGQMVGAGAGAMAEGGSRQFLIDRGMRPEWADLLSTAMGTSVDMLSGGLTDRVGLRKAASDAPLNPKVKRQADLAEEFGAPLRPDEALGNPINRPSVAELTDVAGRASTAKGSGDYLQDRVRNATDHGRRIAEDYGVTYQSDSPSQVQDVTGEVMQLYNAARSGQVAEHYATKNNILGMANQPGRPVDVSDTTKMIESQMERFSRLGDNVFGDAGRRLNGIADDLRSAHSLEELETIRKAIFAMKGDDLVPSGARGEFDRVVDDVYSSLRNDMGRHIQENFDIERSGFGIPQDVDGGEVRATWEYADERLAEMMSDFDRKDIADLIEEAATKPIEFQSVEAVQQLHKANKDPAQYAQLYTRMDAEGRRLSVTAIYGNILEAAGGPLNPDPNKIAQGMAEYGPMLKRAAEISGDPSIREDAVHFVEYVQNVSGWITDFVGSGLTSNRFSLKDHPTGGIVLSQSVRAIGMAAGLFVGDALQGGAGTIARRFNKPEYMRRVMNMRDMDPGSEVWERATRALLRDVYRDAIEEDEAVEEEELLQNSLAPMAPAPVSAESRAPSMMGAEQRTPTTPTGLRGRPEENR